VEQDGHPIPVLVKTGLMDGSVTEEVDGRPQESDRVIT
jgi:hypothetical protein